MRSEPCRAYLPVVCILIYLLLGTSTANVVLIGNNISLSFDDLDANFAPAVKGSGECGILHAAEPLDACLPLTNKVVGEGANSPFALIVRGGCYFVDKVRRAQNAGFKAAIVYDNVDGGGLVAMAGNFAGINIQAVFVSKATGEELKKYVGLPNMELWIIPTFENSAWSIIAISFISLLAISAVLATCFFVRRHRIRREQPRIPHVREFHGMSGQLVSALPSFIFTSVLEDNCTSRTCAICLEDYAVGDKLRVLPCRHKFHAFCVDSWLTIWRTFCPMCKNDARTSIGCPPASEYTPLLSPTPASVSLSPSSSRLSQLPLSLSSVSSAIRIALPRGSSRSPDPFRTHSLSGTPYMPHSFSSYRNSPALSLSQSSVDLRNASSHRSCASHLATPHSMGHPSLFSPLDPRYASPYNPSSSNASLHLAGSSSRLAYPLHCSESATSFSPFASAQSLPGC